VSFFDDEVGGGTPIVKYDPRSGQYSVRGSDEVLNDKEFVVDLGRAQGGYIAFRGAGQPADRRLGDIFPEDKAPRRSTLPDADPSTWTPGKFSNGRPEDPYRATVELPLRHRETGETYILSLQNKMSLSAAREFLTTCRKLPAEAMPIVKLGSSSKKTKFGTFKQPAFSVVGTTGGEDFDDPVDF
jgi:hypothetical protein